MPDAELAIVIAAYHSERTITRCVQAFRHEAPSAEIVVVDSTPGRSSVTADAVADAVRVIHHPTRLNPHAARNIGAAATHAPLLLFTDPDIYPQPGSVDTLLKAHREVGGAVVASFACVGDDYIDRAAHIAKFDMWLPIGRRRRIPIGPTAGFLCRRSDWLRVGRIPESSMLGDTRFSWALTDAGIPLHLEPAAIFDHDHGASLTGLLRERSARGREFSALRSQRWPGRWARYRDVAATVTLVRPARVTYRSVSAAWRASPREAAVTLPVVTAAHAAWFVGELAGFAAARRPEVT